jgi:phytoene dehydrogenase-like protein
MTLPSRKNREKKKFFKPNYTGGNDYDLVIVGGGLSGLTTGLLWLKQRPGTKVLLAEKLYYTGGYVTTFERKGYVFETPQLIGDITAVLDYLGIDLPLRRFEGTFMRRVVVRGSEVDEYRLPLGTDEFTEYLSARFPDQERQIRRLMRYVLSMFVQLRKLKASPGFADKLKTVFVAPKVVASLGRTYTELLDRFGITDPRLREVLETFSVFSGVPPNQASCIQTVGAAITSMTNCHRPEGLFDELPIKMTELFQEWGGELLVKAAAEKIEVEDGRVVGVRIKGLDEAVRARRVVTTIDPKVAMKELVGDEHLPADYLRQLEDTVMSVSSLNVALGLDDGIDLRRFDIDNPYNLVSTGLGTAEKLFEAVLAGDNGFAEDCFHVGVMCPSLTIGGPGTVTIRGVPFAMGRWGEWRREDRKRYVAEKERWAGLLIDIVERYLIPGLRDHVAVTNVSTPATYARYSGSPTGSIYDMASLVTQFGPKRLPLRTPIENLFQPKFSHGIYGAVMNGVQVVDVMLDRELNNGDSLFRPRS